MDIIGRSRGPKRALAATARAGNGGAKFLTAPTPIRRLGARRFKWVRRQLVPRRVLMPSGEDEDSDSSRERERREKS